LVYRRSEEIRAIHRACASPGILDVHAFNLGIAIALGIIGGLIGFSLLSTLYSLVVLVPSVAVGVRRLHDTGRSGWFMLLALIPLIGLVLIYFLAIEGEKNDNAFGPDPKAA
jgi:uncharacterized membrane protein YhaH (DUF805 family)